MQTFLAHWQLMLFWYGPFIVVPLLLLWFALRVRRHARNERGSIHRRSEF